MATDVVESIGATGRDYVDPSAWMAAWPADFTTADERRIGEVYRDAGLIDDFWDTPAATTDATRYPILRAAAGQEHSGTRDTGAGIDCLTNLADGDDVAYNQSTAFFRIEYLEFTYSGAATDSGGSSALVKTNADDCLYDGLLAYDATISSATRGLSMRAVNRGVIQNSIVINMSGSATGGPPAASGIVMEANTGSWVLARNNTVHNIKPPSNDGVGIELSALAGPPVGIAYGRNNIATGCDTDFSYPGTGTHDHAYHYSTDATADDEGGDGHQINQVAADTFVSVTAGSEDLHLKTGANAIGAGQNLGSGDHAVDIDKTDRAAIKQVWDIGAHQFETSSSNEDFFTSNGRGSMPAGDSVLTLRSGVHYPTPADETRAILRLATTWGSVIEDGTAAFDTDEWSAHIDWASWPGSVDVTRNATTNLCAAFWRYAEYIGAAGGGNEWIVRGRGTITVGSASTTGDSATISGVVDENDLVLMIAGVSNDQAVNNNADTTRHTLDWITASTLVRATRGASGGTAEVSFIALELTGANWSVQRITHAYSAAGSDETETITTVGSLAKTFIEPQLRTTNPGLDEGGQEVWLSATNTLSFHLQSGADVGHDAVVYVVENTQSGGTRDMNVQRSGRLSRTGGASSPDEWDDTVTAVSRLDRAMLAGHTSRSTGAGGINERSVIGSRLTATTTVGHFNVDNALEQTYRFEVVELPMIQLAVTADAGSFAVNGVAATLVADRSLTAGAGSFAITGSTASLVADRTLTADSGAYTVTGTAASVLADRTLSAAGGSLAISGTTADLEYGRNIVIETGAYTVTGSATTLLAAPKIDAAAGSFTVTGTAATFTINRAVIADAGTYAITGSDATLEYSAAATTITAESGSYAVTGTAVTFILTIDADAGTFTLTGAAADLEKGFAVVATAGAISLTGTAATLTYSGANPVISAEAGSFAVTGTAVPLVATFVLPIAAGAYTLMGTTAILSAAAQDFIDLTTFSLGRPGMTGVKVNQ